jgi:transcriptional regulator with XRE-family HTH domain
MQKQREAFRNRGAENLGKVLQARGWTPRKLGRILDCDHSTVILWREGLTTPTLRRAIDIERETGVDVHDWVIPVTPATGDQQGSL